jgi:hypothetical protein
LGGAGAAGGGVATADDGAGWESERLHAAVTTMAAQLKRTVGRMLRFIGELPVHYRAGKCSPKFGF